MRTLQIPVVTDPLLERMAAAIRSAPEVPAVAIGDLAADIASGPPAHDRDIPASQLCGNVPLQFDPEEPGVIVRAVLYYPPGGGMGWHTNSARPGWRVYVPHGERGVMLTDDGPIKDRHNHANLFYAPNWHAVTSPGARWSLGVVLPSEHRLVTLVR